MFCFFQWLITLMQSENRPRKTVARLNIQNSIYYRVFGVQCWVIGYVLTHRQRLLDGIWAPCGLRGCGLVTVTPWEFSTVAVFTSSLLLFSSLFSFWSGWGALEVIWLWRSGVSISSVSAYGSEGQVCGSSHLLLNILM